MKERPILFSGPMVRAILDGRKTVTRRVVKPQPPSDCQVWAGWILDSTSGDDVGKASWHDQVGPLAYKTHRVRCPYGQLGDHLWVREAWSYYRPFASDRTNKILYRADLDNCGQCPVQLDNDVVLVDPRDGWKPSIHMPRWASRISLEVTEIRVQRLQDITEDEAIREGAVWHDFGRECGHFGAWQGVGDCKGEFHPQRNGWTMEPPAASAGNCLPSARMAFANLINKINGPETWASNPWVFVISFRRMYAQ